MSRLLLRATLAFLLCPGIVAFLVPLLLAPRDPRAFGAVGLPPLAAGVVLLLWCSWEFLSAGRGTLGPWEPPRYRASVPRWLPVRTGPKEGTKG